MRLVVIVNEKFSRQPDGTLFTHGGGTYPTFARYLAEFDRVRVFARVADSTAHRGGTPGRAASGPGVGFEALPCFRGVRGWAQHYLTVRRILQRAVRPDDAVVLRMPAWHLTDLAARQLVSRGQRFAVEVFGEPRGNFSPAFYRHPLAPLFRFWIPRRTRWVCRQAAAALYVAANPLEQLYPARAGALTVDCSDVDLPKAAFRDAPRQFTRAPEVPRLVFVGSLQNLRKGPDTLLEAIALCGHTRDVHLTLIGAGKLRDRLEKLGHRLGIARRLTWAGTLPNGAPVRDALDQAHLFLLPSHSEGLPRSLVEAMARALPCIASPAGGIPGLLAPEDLVPAGDAAGLASKILDAVRDPSRLSAMSHRNLETARAFEASHLTRRRAPFLAEVRRLARC
ncbi:MAG: glycosyltransferase [Acidobacteriota bacterium]